MNFELIQHALPMLLVGAGVTIEITAVSVAVGFLIGLFVGIARISQMKALRILATVYADCIRGTPLLVQIFLIYFALPIVTGHRVEPFAAAVAACGINSGAYVSEIFRAGIQAIDGNEFIAMLKDSSLVSVIGFEELTRRGQLIIAQTYGSFEIWTTVAVLYLIMTLAISRLVAWLEKR